MANKLNIVVQRLYDYDGSRVCNTGLQRWCRDLAVLANKSDYDVTVYQKASRSFEVELAPAIRVIGIPVSLSFRGNYSLFRWLRRNTNVTDPFVYVSKEMYFSTKESRAVGIDHGIWWDGDYPWYRKHLNKQFQYRLLHGLRGVLCVDTNFINWCHAELPHRRRWQEKLTYVPNYADPALFVERDTTRPATHQDHPLTILFPRRINGRYLDQDIRGAGFFLKAVDVLRARGKDVHVLMVGESLHDGPIAEWAADRGMEGKLEMFSVGMDEMPQIYERADVVVVPTLAHEGTSLSAIESLMSGRPTVVTHIGGLGNVVIPGLNGYVCDLTPDSLADAILESHRNNPLDDPSVLQACRRSLGKSRWDRAVWSWIHEKLQLS